MVLVVDYLMVVVAGGQFLSQIIGKEWPPGRSAGKMGGGHFLVGQSHIRTGITFHYLDLMMEAKMR